MLLTTSQYKLNKSASKGWKTVGLNLSPALEARTVLKDKSLQTMCAMAGSCAAGCLARTGMNVFQASIKARARRTKDYVRDPAGFTKQVSAEITRLHKRYPKLAIRPNLLSDQPRLAHTLARLHP